MAITSVTAKHPVDIQDATSSAKPVATVRYGAISAAIFKDAVASKDGKTTERHKVSLRRSYRDQESGDWKYTSALAESDLLVAAEALRKCFDMIQDRRKS